MTLNLRELEVFRAVMEFGNVTAAAEALRISQPAASKMLHQAEERLGFALFTRHRKRLIATAEAHALLPELIGAFTALRDMQRLADDLRGGRSGQLSIASVPALTTTILPPVVKAFRDQRPDVSVVLRSYTALETINLVADHRADLGLILGAVADRRIEARRLTTAEIGCALPPGHALKEKRVLGVADLQQDAVISLGPQQPVGAALARAFADAGQPHRVAIETSQSVAACALVRAGAGIAVLDGFGLQEARAQGLLTRPLRPRALLTVSLVLARHRVPSRLTQAFMALLENDQKAPRAT